MNRKSLSLSRINKAKKIKSIGTSVRKQNCGTRQAPESHDGSKVYNPDGRHPADIGHQDVDQASHMDAFARPSGYPPPRN